MSRVVCFVCGSLGATSTLHIKPREKGSYFPFLEHHDPPKGCQKPGPGGLIPSCKVCFSFLNQQWECFERTKTPPIKRLYWLKRADDGLYTGAEMNTQGEYAALLFGLHHHRSPYNQYDQGRSNQVPGMMTYKTEVGDDGYVTNQSQSAPVNSDSFDSSGAMDLTGNLKSSKPSAQNGYPEAGIAPSEESASTMVCYTCGKTAPSTSGKFVYSRKQTDAVKYFPFLEKIEPPTGAMALGKQGLTRVCGSCWNGLQTQWKAYELTSTNEENRIYNVGNVSAPTHAQTVIASSPLKGTESPLQSNVKRIEEACFLCGQVYHRDSLKIIYAKPPYKGVMDPMYFPFIFNLKTPSKARQMDGDGRVMACRMCYNSLKHQWHTNEDASIPVHLRTYSLPNSASSDRNLPSDAARMKPSDVAADNANVTKPLNIHIGSSSPSPNVSAQQNQGLLAIASPFNFYANNNDNDAATQKSVSGAEVKGVKISCCFVCGTKTEAQKLHVVSAYPEKGKSEYQTEVKQFFPFLVNRSAAAGAEPILTQGTASCCRYCYHSLLMQWHMYENSKKPGDNNRWLRQYNTTEFVCYVCACIETRKNVKAISLKRHPELKELNRPDGAIVMDDGIIVVVCVICVKKLKSRHNTSTTHETQQTPTDVVLPPKLRKEKYLEHYGIKTEKVDDQPMSSSSLKDDRSVARIATVDEKSYPEGVGNQPAGQSHGYKPPPLAGMVNNSSKISRTTATVPPLSQVSPSNSGMNSNNAISATRASSFAAALRKLAKQASDPNDVVRDQMQISPVSSNTSPHSLTPKKRPGPPPPLIYNQQQQTSSSAVNSSPPVGTIAPTLSSQSKSLMSHEERKLIDRPNSGHSSTSSSVEPLSSLKHDSHYLPPVSLSHERDRRSAAAAAAAAAEDHRAVKLGLLEHSRGFQPYRPGDEVRAALPPPFLDPAYAAYHHAFLPPAAFPHPAFRFDDPLLLERYRMLQPGFLPYPHPGLLPHHALTPMLQGGQYPHDLFRQHHFPLLSPSDTAADRKSPPNALAERQKLETELRREQERASEREQERIRDHQRDQQEAEFERQRLRDRERLKCQQEEQMRIDSQTLKHHHQRETYSARDSGHPNYSHVRPSEDRYSHGSDKYHSSPSRSRRIDDLAQQTAPLNLHVHKDDRLSSSMQTNWEASVGRDSELRSQYDHSLRLDKRSHHEQPVQLGSQSKAPPTIGEPSARITQTVEAIQRPPTTSNKLMNGYEQSTSLKAERHATTANERIPSSTSERDLMASSSHLRHPAVDLHDSKKNENNMNTLSSVVEPTGSGICKPTLSNSNDKSHIDHNHFLPSAKEFLLQFAGLGTTSVGHEHDHFKDISFFKSLDSRVTIRSKLDILEERISTARQDGSYYSDSDFEDDLIEAESRRNHKLSMISTQLPSSADASTEKRRHMRYLGLVTKRRKRTICYEQTRKRRRLYREGSVSPVQLVSTKDTVENKQPLHIPSRTPKLADKPCSEAEFIEKSQFLSSIGLNHLSAEGRKELEEIRRACDSIQERRSGQVPDEENDDTKQQLDGATIQKSQLMAGVKRKYEDISPVATVTDVKDELKDESNNGERGIDVPGAIDKHILSKEFAQEFHESVLKTTRQQEQLRTKHFRGNEILPSEMPSHKTASSAKQPYDRVLQDQPTDLSAYSKDRISIPRPTSYRHDSRSQHQRPLLNKSDYSFSPIMAARVETEEARDYHHRRHLAVSATLSTSKSELNSSSSQQNYSSLSSSHRLKKDVGNAVSKDSKDSAAVNYSRENSFQHIDSSRFLPTVPNHKRTVGGYSSSLYSPRERDPTSLIASSCGSGGVGADSSSKSEAGISLPQSMRIDHLSQSSRCDNKGEHERESQNRAPSPGAQMNEQAFAYRWPGIEVLMDAYQRHMEGFSQTQAAPGYRMQPYPRCNR
ncbi:uncharacterized protein LOC141902586 isoform X2 [Tubulanus polymorphus]|uniref:uncharacterized protein LOC141902586 isoform X2 n=1 Tax=Tubulanus polymorphus TaxID=672921 RepID=UPI003DA60DFC